MHPQPASPAAPRRPSRSPRPNSWWAALYAVIGGLLVAGYFFLASLVAIMTLGGEPSEHQRQQSDQLASIAMVMALAAPFAAALAHAVVDWAGRPGRRRDPRSGVALTVIVVGWLLSFAAAWFLFDLWPSDDRPVAFGVLWALGGAVVTPAVAADGTDTLLRVLLEAAASVAAHSAAAAPDSAADLVTDPELDGCPGPWVIKSVSGVSMCRSGRLACESGHERCGWWGSWWSSPGSTRR